MFTFVPIGLPRLDTKWIMASRNVLCSGVDISVMKAAMPILRWDCVKDDLEQKVSIFNL